MSEEKKAHIPDINIDTANLCREESYTDLKTGTIQVLIPVKPDGSDDPARMRQFIGQTQIMSQMGPMPLTGPIEAETLEEAIEKFGDAINDAVEKLMEEAQKRQVEEANRIVTPGQMAGGAGGMGGLGGAGGAGGGGLPGGGLSLK